MFSIVIESKFFNEVITGPAKDYNLAINIGVSDMAQKVWTMSVEEIEDCWEEIKAKINDKAIDRAELDKILRAKPENSILNL